LIDIHFTLSISDGFNLVPTDQELSDFVATPCLLDIEFTLEIFLLKLVIELLQLFKLGEGRSF
jgi:hypothetical protein